MKIPNLLTQLKNISKILNTLKWSKRKCQPLSSIWLTHPPSEKGNLTLTSHSFLEEIHLLGRILLSWGIKVKLSSKVWHSMMEICGKLRFSKIKRRLKLQENYLSGLIKKKRKAISLNSSLLESQTLKPTYFSENIAITRWINL